MPERPGPSLRRRRLFLLPVVVLLAVGFQIPVVWAIGRIGGHPSPVATFAAALTAAFLSGLLQPRALWGAPTRRRLYLVMWPFFVWWMGGLLFTLLLPIALVVRALAGLPTETVLTGTLALAAAGTLASLSHRPRVRRREVAIVGLPPAFEGYRIAQISDLHCGPFASGRRVAAWVAAVNRLAPDLIAVTGDLIASGPEFVPVVASALGHLQATGGVFACMGNHDYFTEADLAQALESSGLTVLRNRGVEIRRGGQAIYLAGVDDTWTRRHDLRRALADRPAGTPVVLLAHDPALFPEAAAAGVDLTLSGHTHGGQIGLPLFSRRFNLARVMTRFTTDLYRSGSSLLYVNRGLGTTGPPVRLAVAPEIAVLTLRRAATADAAASTIAAPAPLAATGP